MKFQFIRDHREDFPVRLMCRVLDVSSSGFYDWLERPESPRAVENRALVAKIQAIHGDSRRTYGSPRVHASLQDAGYRIGRHRVARLMRDHGIRAKTKRKFRVTTDSRHDHPVAPNRLDRQFEVAAPNTVWVADISYIPTREGWLYLAVVLDLFSRQVVGWAMDQQMPQELTLAALDMAIQRRRPLPGCMHHSDRGSQYAAGDYQKQLAKYGMVCSMSRKGNCWDNAPMESFFHSLKTELVHHRDYQTRDEARRDIFEYIEVFYNRQRRHSTLGYLSPAQFELAALAA
jgi:transposase InsO family protein